MTRKRSKGQPARVESPGDAFEERKKKGREPAQSHSADVDQPPFLSAAGMREVVESVVIAFVLAFLFRTFEAEAFVIPTGSMAPTLMGRHKDVRCSECGYQFQVSASDEIDSATNRRTGRTIGGGTCPMCRHTMDLGPDNPLHETYRSYKGDRILVAKFAYRFGGPERWDVAVFKFPGGAKTNFIKRIVGLPRETVGISRGDLYVKPLESEDFERFRTPSYRYGGSSIDLEDFTIARKPPAKLRAVLQPVYDNDCVLEEWIAAGWPARWSPVPGDSETSGWQTSEDYRSFQTDGSAGGETWIEYRHFIPSHRDWQAFEEGTLPANENRTPALITDFSAYNTEVGTRERLEPDSAVLGLHWVGDLAVECEMEVESQSGETLFELVEGGRVFRCGIDVSTGKATLSIEGGPEFHSTESTPVRGPGTYSIMFANVDDQLTLWVKNKVVRFENEGKYGPLGNRRARSEDRYRPVRIGSRQAALRIDHLRVYRDIYYIAERLGKGDSGGILTDRDTSYFQFETPEEVDQVLDDPLEWAFFRSSGKAIFPLGDGRFLMVHRDTARYAALDPWDGGYPYTMSRELLSGVPLTDPVGSRGQVLSTEEVRQALSPAREWAFHKAMRQVAFPLDEDQFLVLGDNSAESKDSRLWESDNLGHYVNRDLLMGKALFVYWPHSLDRIPYTKVPIRFLPNVSRMHFVR